MNQSLNWIIKKTNQLFLWLTVFSLAANVSLFNLPFLSVENTPEAQAQDLCQVPADVVLVMDTSGSMADGGSLSRCAWRQLELIGSSYQWVNHSESDITEAVCATKCGSLNSTWCTTPVYTPSRPNKMESAKTAGRSFLDNMGSNDQSAIVFFSDSANLAKTLSGDHAATKAAINGLTPTGATNIGGAIESGLGELNSVRANPQAVKAMILLTDGKANRPNGNGYGENPFDVAYAESKAAEAAALGHKIFTIGLGTNGEINETMLQNIANTTGAQYYHASNGDDLSGIYDQIAFEVCQYGSISGCKYSDANNNGAIDTGEPKLSGWEIALGGNATSTQLTDENGCYSFSGLLAGSYTIAESANTEKQPFVPVWPVSNLHTIDLTDGQDAVDFNFANYLPVCGNNILDGDYGETCDDGNTESQDGCSSTCQTESPAAQNVISGYKYKDQDGVATTTGDWLALSGWNIYLYLAQNTSTYISTTSTNNNGFYNFVGLAAGDYLLTEEASSTWSQLLAPGPISATGTSTTYADNNFVNFLIPLKQCANGIDDDDDGLIDSADPGCHSDNNDNNSASYDPTDDNEADEPGISNGDIVINEIMQNPSAVSDNHGEWFEVYNTTGSDINLKNCEVKDWGTNIFTINSDLIVAGNDYAVLAQNGNSGQNGGYTADYVYNNFALGNGYDSIIITCENVEIDKVEYDDGDSFPDPTGASMVLSSPFVDNNVGGNWCTSSTVFGRGDKGTPGSLNDTCGAAPICGNGTIESGETCDDGGNNGRYGYCNATCTGQTSAVCGNNVIEGEETCDDGNTESQDGCSSTCQTESPAAQNVISGYKYKDQDGVATTTGDWLALSGWNIYLYLAQNTSTYISTTSTNNNGFYNFVGLAAGDYLLTEEASSTWSQLLAPGPISATGTSTTYADNNFVNFLIPVCGNGVREGSEVCDNGLNNGIYGYCNATCTGQTSAVCGNNVVEGEEICDNGGNNGQYGYCNVTCTGQTLAVCGNGVREGDEACDDSNVNNDDGCSSICQIESSGSVCGNNVREGNEVCDNGLNNGVYGYCNATCTGQTLAVCGNNVVEGEEICDDGGNNGRYGYCNSTCTAQTSSVCGNGVREGDEACDGNDGVISGYTCNSVCRLETTGGGGGTGGGGLPSVFTIYNEASQDIQETSVLITWQTNMFATSRVIYGAESDSHDFDFTFAPNYGYASSTAEDSTAVTFHQIPLIGLKPDTLYYYRVVSHTPSAAIDSVGITYAFRTLKAQAAALPIEVPLTPPLAFQPPIGGGENEPEAGNIENPPAGLNLEENTGTVAGETAVIENENGQVAGAAENCGPYSWWPLILLIADCLALLLINYLSRKRKNLLWPFLILLIAIPVIDLFYCRILTWWMWLLVIIIFILFVYRHIRNQNQGNTGSSEVG